MKVLGMAFLAILSLTSGALARERPLLFAQQSEPDRLACLTRCESTSIACSNGCEDRFGGGLPGTTRRDSDLIECRIACNATYGACSRACK
jgi:hypothetical protein